MWACPPWSRARSRHTWPSFFFTSTQSLRWRGAARPEGRAAGALPAVGSGSQKGRDTLGPRSRHVQHHLRLPATPLASPGPAAAPRPKGRKHHSLAASAITYCSWEPRPTPPAAAEREERRAPQSFARTTRPPSSPPAPLPLLSFRSTGSGGEKYRDWVGLGDPDAPAPSGLGPRGGGLLPEDLLVGLFRRYLYWF